MAEEKVFTIPLREAFEKERQKRARNASKIVREFLIRHMKSEKIKIGKSINETIWKRGIYKPPRRLRVHAIKEEDIVYAELLGVDIKTPSKEEVKKKEEKKKEKKEKIKEERKERRKKTIQEEIKEEVKGKLEEAPKELKPEEATKEKPKEAEKIDEKSKEKI
jgi:large subunit ribosomal protein L31e